MKEFKFFKGTSEKYLSLPRNNILTQRSYVGLNRGEIKWINSPIGIIHYMEPSFESDPITEDSIPEINLRLLSETIIVSTMIVPSFEYFMEVNWNKYIFVYTVADTMNNIYTSEETIPRGVPLSIRCEIKD